MEGSIENGKWEYRKCVWRPGSAPTGWGPLAVILEAEGGEGNRERGKGLGKGV